MNEGSGTVKGKGLEGTVRKVYSYCENAEKTPREGVR